MLLLTWLWKNAASVRQVLRYPTVTELGAILSIWQATLPARSRSRREAEPIKGFEFHQNNLDPHAMYNVETNC